MSFSKKLLSCVFGLSLVGCAMEVASTPKEPLDVAAEDAIILAAEGSSDSAQRPTFISEVVPGAAENADFSRSSKYLAWTFELERGDKVLLRARGVHPTDMDTVLLLYKANDYDRPTGAALASNDDAEHGVRSSEIAIRIPADGVYVAIVRRQDRGSSGTVRFSLSRDDSNCPLTGIPCLEQCRNGHTSTGNACDEGHYNSHTCECEPL